MSGDRDTVTRQHGRVAERLADGRQLAFEHGAHTDHDRRAVIDPDGLEPGLGLIVAAGRKEADDRQDQHDPEQAAYAHDRLLSSFEAVDHIIHSGATPGTAEARQAPVRTSLPRFPGSVRPGVYDRGMGSVTSLSEWRERRDRDPMSRLDRAIARLDGLLRRNGSGRLAARVESELLAITGAVSAGLEDAAAERAERLAERLEHPSARRSS